MTGSNSHTVKLDPADPHTLDSRMTQRPDVLKLPLHVTATMEIHSPKEEIKPGRRRRYNKTGLSIVRPSHTTYPAYALVTLPGRLRVVHSVHRSIRCSDSLVHSSNSLVHSSVSLVHSLVYSLWTEKKGAHDRRRYITRGLSSPYSVLASVGI